jgi:endonuclease YncB( thermonuclease family)
MQILITLAATAVAVVQTSSLPASTIRSPMLLVRAVASGDTIDVATIGHVRLAGISVEDPGRGVGPSGSPGREARDRLAQLVLHRWVRLEQERASAHGQSRRPAYVLTEDGVCVNVALVRDGLARVSARASLTRLPELQRAEAEARLFRRGIWGIRPVEPGSELYSAINGHPPAATRNKALAWKRRKTRKKKP